MLKRHEVQVLLKAGHGPVEAARLAGVSLASVTRIAQESAVQEVEDAAELHLAVECLNVKREVGCGSGVVSQPGAGFTPEVARSNALHASRATVTRPVSEMALASSPSH